MKNAITIRLDDELDRMLNQVSRNLRRSRSDVIRDSLRRQLSILIFDSLREKAVPFAEKKGYFTDDDIFREIS
jgi:predicted transcriptional regulator